MRRSRRRRIGIDGPPEPQPACVDAPLNARGLGLGFDRLLFDWHILFHNLLIASTFILYGARNPLAHARKVLACRTCSSHTKLLVPGQRQPRARALGTNLAPRRGAEPLLRRCPEVAAPRYPRRRPATV